MEADSALDAGGLGAVRTGVKVVLVTEALVGTRRVPRTIRRRELEAELAVLRIEGSGSVVPFVFAARDLL